MAVIGSVTVNIRGDNAQLLTSLRRSRLELRKFGAEFSRTVPSSTSGFARVNKQLNTFSKNTKKAGNDTKNLGRKVRGLDANFLDLTKSILKSAPAFAVATAAIGAVAGAIRGIKTEFVSGLAAVEDFKIGTASMAAFLTTFSAKAAGGDIAGAFQEASIYSEQLVKKLEIIDAKTVATGRDLRIITETMITNGVVLNIQNQKQIQGFINIANATKLITKGQNQEIQLRQEIRALMKGQLKDSNLLVKLLQAQDPNIKENLRLWKEQGILIEKVGELLKGFTPATKSIEETWSAIGTTLETIHDRILRGAFLPIYTDLLDLSKQIRDTFMDANGQLTPLAKSLQKDIGDGWKTLTAGIRETTKLVKDLKSVYDSFPSGVGGSAGVGLIGALLFGTKAGVLIGTLNFLNNQLGKVNVGFGAQDRSLGSLVTKWNDYSKAVADGLLATKLGVSVKQLDKGRELLALQTSTGEAPKIGAIPEAFFAPPSGPPDLSNTPKPLPSLDKSGFSSFQSLKKQLTSEAAQKKSFLDKERKKEASVGAGGAIKRIGHVDISGGYDKILKDREAKLRKHFEKQQEITEENNIAFLKSQKEAFDSSAIGGLTNAVEEYGRIAGNVGDNVKNAFRSMFSTMEDAIVQFVKTGKFNFKDFANSIIEDMIRIQARQALSGLLSMGINAAVNLFNPVLGPQTASQAAFYPTPTGAPIPGRAKGGPVAAGQSYIVGENRAELFTPGVSGTITPYVPEGGGGDTFNVDMRGASVEAVQRLEQFVAQINGSLENRAVSAMVNMQRRGAI